MTRTYRLDENDMRRALEEYVRRREKIEGSIRVHLHHDRGDRPFDAESFSAEVVETPAGPPPMDQR
jgi:hypothetical protein